MIKNIMMTLSLLMICNSSLATDIINVNTTTTASYDYSNDVMNINIKDEGYKLVLLLKLVLQKGEYLYHLNHINITNESSQLITTNDIQMCINEYPNIKTIKIKQNNTEGIELTQIQVDQKTVSIQRGLEGDITVIAVDTRPRNRMNTTFLNGESNMDTGRINRAFTPKSHNNPLEKK